MSAGDRLAARGPRGERVKDETGPTVNHHRRVISFLQGCANRPVAWVSGRCSGRAGKVGTGSSPDSETFHWNCPDE
ncbi:MAG: hypothetical protein D8M59_10425 [Planctomycetes bacterium]|nr:hypothetical protein [Planctomycetota bacterium]